MLLAITAVIEPPSVQQLGGLTSQLVLAKHVGAFLLQRDKLMSNSKLLQPRRLARKPSLPFRKLTMSAQQLQQQRSTGNQWQALLWQGASRYKSGRTRTST